MAPISETAAIAPNSETIAKVLCLLQYTEHGVCAATALLTSKELTLCIDGRFRQQLTEAYEGKKEFLATNPTPRDVFEYGAPRGLGFTAKEFLSTNPTPSEMVQYGKQKLGLDFSKEEFLSRGPDASQAVRYGPKLGLVIDPADVVALDPSPFQLIHANAELGMVFTTEEFLSTHPSAHEMVSYATLCGVDLSKEDFLSCKPNLFELVDCGLTLGIGFTKEEISSLDIEPTPFQIGYAQTRLHDELGLISSYTKEEFHATKPTPEDVARYEARFA